ncbi:MAG: class I SAM-dependent methyltransferase [Solirubrobacterales bacterium]|nr:class I SAM-dependent methyltransferase [Solirubrobacterales bacterium]
MPDGPLDLPVPPLDLLHRTGHMGDKDPVDAYFRDGRKLRGWIESFLPPDWTWSGKRTLDFGCGAGKVLRQLADVASDGEVWGCDIDGPSIEWTQANICPPFHTFQNGEEPGIDKPDGYFDLIFALSVYTHITDHWAGWLLEHHRLLAPGGYLFATFLGAPMLKQLIGETWEDDNIGMNGLLAGYPWSRGGPVTFISEWWLRAHWGRLFDVVELRPYAYDNPPASQGLVLLRRKDVELTVEDLEALEPNEPREISALRHHARQLRDETLRIRAAHDDLAERVQAYTRVVLPPQGKPLTPAPAGKHLHAELARDLLHGEGIEIDHAGQAPLPVPNGVKVGHVQHGETLATLPGASQDFIIANHFLQQSEDPIATISTHLSKLKPDGVLYYAVPDKRYTFDYQREITPLEHVIADHQQGPERSRAQHYWEWVRWVDPSGADPSDMQDLKRTAERLDANNHSIHFHVWTQAELLELVLYLRAEHKFEFDLVAFRPNEIENIVALRKCVDPSALDKYIAALNTPPADLEAAPEDFDPRSYLIHNPDVQFSGADPYTHYAQYGRDENRKW